MFFNKYFEQPWKQQWKISKFVQNNKTTPTFDTFLPPFGRSWALLGHFWPLLGRPWPLLGRSWPLLGGSWPLLDRSWPLLGRHQKNMKKSMPKMTDLDLQKPPKASQHSSKMTPKSMQKTSKNRCKKPSEKRTEKSSKTHAPAHTHTPNISRILSRFWLPKRPKIAPQNDSKTIKKITRKKNPKKERKKTPRSKKTWLSCERKAAFENAFRYLRIFDTHFFILCF